MLTADDLLKKLAATGIRRVQIALDPVRENAGGAWTDVAAKAAAQGVALVSGMMGTIGEDYTTLDSIRRTGGVVPDATWPGNWKSFEANADLPGRLGSSSCLPRRLPAPRGDRPVVRQAAGPPPPHGRPIPGPGRRSRPGDRAGVIPLPLPDTTKPPSRCLCRIGELEMAGLHYSPVQYRHPAKCPGSPGRRIIAYELLSRSAT